MVQLHVSKIKADNLGRAQKLVKEAAGQGAKVVVLPVSNIFLYIFGELLKICLDGSSIMLT